MEFEISVIIPCYNVENYLDRCIDSLVNQTIGIEKLQLIFVDDASTDGTVSKLSEWEKRYPDQIMVICCEENGKQGRARNIGLEYAGGQYLTFVDADDWIDLNMYEEMYRVMRSQKVDYVICNKARDHGDGILFGEDKIFGGKAGLVIIDSIEKRKWLLHQRSSSHCCTLYQKEFIENNDLFFPEGVIYEDNFFGIIQSFAVKSLYIINKVYYHYFANYHSTVSARNNINQLDRLIVEKYTYDVLEQKGFMKDYAEEIKGRFLQLYYLNTLHLIFLRFDTLPYDVLNEMKEEVLKRFPEYKSSAFYQKLPDLSKGFCLTLETEMTEEKWDTLAQNYRYIEKMSK